MGDFASSNDKVNEIGKNNKNNNRVQSYHNTVQSNFQNLCVLDYHYFVNY